MSRFEDHEDLQMLQDKEISARPQNHVLLELERTLEIVKSSCLVLTMKKKPRDGQWLSQSHTAGQSQIQA